MDSDSDGSYDDYSSDGSEYDEHGEEEDQAEYDEHQVEVEEEEGDTDEGGTTDQEEMTDEREVTDAGETGDEWDTDGERSTDEEEEETEDEEITGGPFNIPYLYNIPHFVSSRPFQHGSTPATQATAEAEPTTKETWEITKPILEDKTTYKALLQTTGDKAQALLDVMQKLLDDQSTPNDLRNRILRAVAHLCARSSLYPQCLVLRDIQHEKEREAFGSFGDIWIGSYKGHRVCMKTARIYRRQDVNKLFKSYAKEAIIWSQFSHPNLLPFYGIYYIQGEQGDTSSRIGLVSPWMQNGNIRDYMQTNPEIPRRPLVDDTLAGLMYLHRLNIVHADIKGVNILISPNGSACVADFGLSSIVDAGTLDWTSVQTTHTVVGTLRWTAPELLDDAESDGAPRPTFASDVYSMASTMYEILADKIPFYEFRSNVTVISKVIRGIRPSKPPEEPELELSDEVWELMLNCWSETPSNRPTMDEIAEKLNNIPYNEVATRRMAQHQMNPDNHEILSFTSQSFRDAIRGGESNISAAELDFLKEFSSSGSVKASLIGQVAGEVAVVNQS